MLIKSQLKNSAATNIGESRGLGAFYNSLQLGDVMLEAWAMKTTSPWVPISHT